MAMEVPPTFLFVNESYETPQVNSLDLDKRTKRNIDNFENVEIP